MQGGEVSVVRLLRETTLTDTKDVDSHIKLLQMLHSEEEFLLFVGEGLAVPVENSESMVI